MATFVISDRSFVGDLEIIESLDAEASRRQFRGLLKFKPTLEKALREAGVPNHDIVLENSIEFSSLAREDPEIAELGLTDDEAGAISCYTLEAAEGIKSPYAIINQGLAGSRNRATLSSTRKLIYLLLSGLRKLPRFRASRGQIFHRAIKVRVPQSRGEANGRQFYAKGRTVTWWGFTSTTTDLGAMQDFIDGASESTLFNIGGEDLWGYDIKAFSQFWGEKEILIEPEAKIFVDGILTHGTLTTINVTLQKFEKLILEDIIPVGIAAGKNVEKKWECIWKDCPDYVDGNRKYTVDVKNPRIATFIGGNWCTIIGNTPLPLNKVTSWNIKILKSYNNGSNIYVGVAPSNINQNKDDNSNKCGWYFYCFHSTLTSGPPHNYWDKDYGPRKGDGQYVHTGDSVGVVMDMEKGELSFVLDGVNHGVAYEGIPLDKPLVPCVLLLWPGDSVELVI